MPGACGYLDTCDHILWVHNGRALDPQPLTIDLEGEFHSDFWKDGYEASGHIWVSDKVGSIVIDPNIGCRKARRIAEEVLAEFPGIKFWVYYDAMYSTVQEFWEGTE